MKNNNTKTYLVLFFTALLFIAALSTSFSQEAKSDKLLIVFTSSDQEVFTKMAGAYQMFGMKQGWWKETRFLIWGPSAKMIAESEEAQELLKGMKEAGVELLACKWCAEQYGVQDKLASLGVEVKYMGQGLTDMIKSDWYVLTF